MERPARPRRRLRRRRGAEAGNKENQIPAEVLATCAPPLRLAVERLSGAHGGAKPRWMNLDSQVNSLEAVAILHAACKAQATPSLVTLSLRYCALPAAGANGQDGADGQDRGGGSDDALMPGRTLSQTNGNRGALYPVWILHEAWKDALTEVWHARGALHSIRNDGQTFFRKVDLAYLRDRASYVPARFIRPKQRRRPRRRAAKEEAGTVLVSRRAQRRASSAPSSQ